VALASFSAQAQWSVQVAPAAAFAVSAPQASYYGPGFSGSLQGALEVLSVLDVQVSGSYVFLTQAPGSALNAPGSALSIGAGMRVRRPWADALVVPFAQAEVGYVRTGISNRVLVGGSVGVLFRAGEGSRFLLGPTARIMFIPRLANEVTFTTRDATVFSVGLAFELSAIQAKDPVPDPPLVIAREAAEPDRDSDGVPDAVDACPTVPGAPADLGCPKYKQVVVTETKIEIQQKIFFAFGKTTILPKAYELLDEVVQALKDHSLLFIRIEGHTDSIGSDAANLQLSQGRAEAVREYLVEHGVPADHLDAKGYGPSLPLDTNATTEGREKNRRVEFTIIRGKAP
jgi:outer membrane protein OmpA-like peptidoglycan-associated protein